MVADVQYLLQLLGIPYVVSPSEAEAQCAMLERLHLTNGSITDDNDVFLFGGSIVFRNVCSKRKGVERYTSEDIQKNLCWNESVGMADLEKLYNRPIFGVKEINSRYDFGNGFELVADPLLNHWKKFIRRDTFYSFQVNTANDFLARVNPRVEFSILLRKVFSSILPKPEGFYFNSIELPLGITIFQAGETIFNDLPLISTYYFQGKIGYSQKGYPIQASIKKMVKSIPLEPLPGDGDGSLRHYLMAGLFTSRFKISTINDSQINTIQQLFKSNFSNFNLTPVFLKHLKGIIQIIRPQYLKNVV
jgi:hypothetical protein